MRQWLISTLRANPAAWAGGAVLLAAAGMLPGLLALAVSEWVGALQASAPLLPPTLAVLACSLAIPAVTMLRTLWVRGVVWEALAERRAQLQRRLLTRRRQELGPELAAVGEDLDQLQYALSAAVTALRNPVTVASLLVVALALAPAMVPWVVLVLPIVALPAWWAGRALRRAALEAHEARAALLQVAQRQLIHRHAIAADGQVDAQLHRFAKRSQVDGRARLRLDLGRLLPRVATQLALVVAGGVLAWRGVVLLDQGVPWSGLVGFGAAMAMLRSPVVGLAEVWSLWNRAAAAWERIDAHWADVKPPLPQPVPRDAEGVLRAATGQRGGFELGPVTVVIPAARLTVVVGASGAGKSTLMRWLLGAESPDQGDVRWGGVAAASLFRAHPGWIRWCGQQAAFYGETVREVLDPAAKLPDVELHEVLQALGLEGTPLHAAVGTLGDGWSGGEGHRLALARTLLARGRVLLLDEPTAALDAQTRDQVIDRVRVGERTVVWVTHDEAIAAHADQVIWLVGGRVAGVGAHTELLRQPGYRQILDGAERCLA